MGVTARGGPLPPGIWRTTMPAMALRRLEGQVILRRGEAKEEVPITTPGLLPALASQDTMLRSRRGMVMRKKVPFAVLLTLTGAPLTDMVTVTGRASMARSGRRSRAVVGGGTALRKASTAAPVAPPPPLPPSASATKLEMLSRMPRLRLRGAEAAALAVPALAASATGA